ncbi:Methyltransferase hemK like protein [Termitomyces sp. T112]|nr:Methyltransferase hemK like protein [Termitomyces sp. T112]
MASKLLSALTAALGPRQATNELRWMQRHLPSGPDLAKMVQRRVAGEPLQYILGSQPFGPLNLLTRPPVLIPRPETEHWVIKLAERITTEPQLPKRLLDLGTGSGCIPLLLCHLLPQGSLDACGVDISEHALRLATDNAELCGTPTPTEADVGHKNTFMATDGNVLSPSFSADAKINPPYDIVTSNPPYIPREEFLCLPRSVSDYEDHRALLGGEDGLLFYRAIASLVSKNGFLHPGAIVALEIGHQQAQDVEKIMLEANMHNVEIWSDPWGKHRTVVAHR